MVLVVAKQGESGDIMMWAYILIILLHVLIAACYVGGRTRYRHYMWEILLEEKPVNAKQQALYMTLMREEAEYNAAILNWKNPGIHHLPVPRIPPPRPMSSLKGIPPEPKPMYGDTNPY